MATTRWWFLVGLVLLLAAGLTGWTHWANAAEGAPPPNPGGAPTVTPDVNPILNVVVGESVTEYEQDPFDTTRLRRATTRVRTLIYVRADGTTETKQIR